jgi:hypothetical protein
MKLGARGLPVIAGAALLALVAPEPAAHVQRVTFTYKPPGSLVTWTVPVTGLYQITAYGAGCLMQLLLRLWAAPVASAANV